MRSALPRTIGVALAALALAATAQAQHTSHGNGHGKGETVETHQGDHPAGAQPHQGDHSGSVQQHQGDHPAGAQPHQGDHPAGAQPPHSGNAQQHQGENLDIRGNHDSGGDVPPGLAGKSGQMPPGQYRKQYDPTQGASVLGDVLRQRGYTVTRTVQSGSVQYVYYRSATGTEQLAMVGPGADRLQFRNLPAALLQEVLARLY